MGMSTDIWKYNFKEVVEAIQTHEDVKDNEEFIKKMLLEFGEVHEGIYFIVTNDYYANNGYCAYYELIEFLERYYSESVSDAFWRLDRKELLGSANAEDAAERLGVELPYVEE